MAISSAERWRRFKRTMEAKGYKRVGGLWAPDDKELRKKIRKKVSKMVEKHERKQVKQK